MSAPDPVRFGQDVVTTALQLCPLTPVIGPWRGTVRNAIWRPDNTQPSKNSATKRFLSTVIVGAVTRGAGRYQGTYGSFKLTRAGASADFNAVGTLI
jgi:hypothetical protein